MTLFNKLLTLGEGKAVKISLKILALPGGGSDSCQDFFGGFDVDSILYTIQRPEVINNPKSNNCFQKSDIDILSIAIFSQ